MKIQIFLVDEGDVTLINRQYSVRVEKTPSGRRYGVVPDGLQAEIEDMVECGLKNISL